MNKRAIRHEPSIWRSPPSRSSSAKARSCGWARRRARGKIAVISSGSLGLDLALGVGGYPAGSGRRDLRPRVVGQDHPDPARHRRGPEELVARPPSSTPSTPWTSTTPEGSGVKTDELLISQPDCGEQALEIADVLVRSGAVDIIVIDSVAALTPRAELEGDMGDTHVGLQARLMSQALRKLTGNISQEHVAGHLHQPDPHEDRRDVRQPRDHDRRQRAEVLLLGATGYPTDRRDQAGRPGRSATEPGFAVVKNKLAPPFREVEFDIMYGLGISRAGDLLDLGVDNGIVVEIGGVVLFRKRADRPRSGERKDLPPRASGDRGSRSSRSSSRRFDLVESGRGRDRRGEDKPMNDPRKANAHGAR